MTIEKVEVWICNLCGGRQEFNPKKRNVGLNWMIVPITKYDAHNPFDLNGNPVIEAHVCPKCYENSSMTIESKATPK